MKTTGWTILAVLGAALPAAAQTVLYDNTAIQVNALNEPFVPDTENRELCSELGCQPLAYLEDVTVAEGGTIGEITFSAFNAARLIGDDILACFGNLSAEGDVEVYADPDGAGPDADLDGLPDEERLIAYAPFTIDSLACGDFVEDTLILSVNVAHDGAVVAPGDRIFVRIRFYKDFFRQVQAGPPAIGSTANGYWLADPTISPPDSGFIRSGDANANLYLKITTAVAPPACACETDGAPGVDVFDLLAYLDVWFAADVSAERDGTDGVDVFDLLAFLDCWFPASAGMPCL